MFFVSSFVYVFFCLFLWDITTQSRFHCLEGSTFNGTWEIPPELGGTATIVVSHWDLTNPKLVPGISPMFQLGMI